MLHRYCYRPVWSEQIFNCGSLFLSDFWFTNSRRWTLIVDQHKRSQNSAHCIISLHFLSRIQVFFAYYKLKLAGSDTLNGTVQCSSKEIRKALCFHWGDKWLTGPDVAMQSFYYCCYVLKLKIRVIIFQKYNYLKTSV